MASLMRRQGGEVAGDVRFADVPPSKPPAQVARELLDKIPGGGVGVEVAGAGSDTSNAKNAVFLGMAIFALLPAAAAPGAPLAGPPAPQLGVALGPRPAAGDFELGGVLLQLQRPAKGRVSAPAEVIARANLRLVRSPAFESRHHAGSV